MIDPAEFALAQAYEQLAAHPAFVNLRQWLTEHVATLELSAVTASVSEPNRAARGKLIAWQQARTMLTLIDDKIAAAAAYRAEAAEEMAADERTAADRADRSGW